MNRPELDLPNNHSDSDEQAMSESIERMIERYELIIESKEEEIVALKNKIEQLSFYADKNHWNRPREAPEITKELAGLPVPRLQIELSIESDYEFRWFYSLIYRHTTDGLIALPMGETISRGGHSSFKFTTKEDAYREMPYREGVHIRRDSYQLELPAYAVWENKFFELDPIID